MSRILPDSLRKSLRKPLRNMLLAVLALVGVQQLGTSALIYAKAALAPHLMAYAWEASLNDGGQPHKPWPWADTWPVARLSVPELGIEQYVLAGATGNALAFGPGLDSAGAAPGDTGTTIIAGHRDTHFSFLQELKPAMTFDIELADGRSLRYRAGAAQVIDSRQPAARPSLTGPARLELVTCYPFDAVVPGGPLRYIVSATPVSVPASELASRASTRSASESVLELAELGFAPSNQGEIAL